MSDQPCPPESVLADYALGKVAELDMTMLEQHFQECQKCQTTVDALNHSDTLIERLRDKPAEGPQDADPELQRALAASLKIAKPAENPPPNVEQPVPPPPAAAADVGEFDPYYEWLGIPPEDQPPDHYRLLGIKQFEDNPSVIESAADRQMGHVRTFQSGQRAKHSQALLNEISRARRTLLDAKQRAAYDRQLQAALQVFAAADHASSPWPSGKRPESAAQFEQCLLASRILTAEALTAFKQSLPPNAKIDEVKSLAAELVRAKQLTKYQAVVVYQGLPHPLVLGEYKIVDKLGAGGMGDVFKARHERMDRFVAVKVLSSAAVSSKQKVERFQKEVRAAAQVSHPNVVTAFDAGEQDGVYYLVMEYVEGRDLSSLVKQSGPLPVEQAVECIIQAAEGLAYAHDKEIIHRDIKPGNLMLCRMDALVRPATTDALVRPERSAKSDEGVQPTVKVLDLGLARLQSESATGKAPAQLTQSGQIMGTVEYMSPEQAEDTRIADARSDTYSLGCTLYKLLTGEAPFPFDTTMKILIAHRESPVPSLRDRCPEVSAQLDATFQKMLAKAPQDRQQTMREVIHDLRTALAAPTVPGRPKPAPPRELPLPPPPPKQESADSQLTAFFNKIEQQPPNAAAEAKPARPAAQPKSKPAASWLRSHPARALGIAGTLAASVVLLGVLLTIRTPYGTIVVESPDNTARIAVKQNGKTVQIIDADKNWQIEIEEGKYTVELAGGNDRFNLDVDSIDIVRDRRTVLRVSINDTSQEVVTEDWLTVDLLKGVDIESGVISGKGRLENGALIIEAPDDAKPIIDIPYALPATYDLEVEVTRTRAPTEVKVGFLLAEKKCSISIDAHPLQGFVTALEKVDGREIQKDNPTAHLGSVLTNGKPAKVLLQVRNDKMRLSCDEKQIIDWKGNPNRLTPAGPRWEHTNTITLSTFRGTTLKFSRLIVRHPKQQETATNTVAPPLAIAPFDAEQARKHQEAWATHLGVPVEFTNSIDMKFRLIPPGEYLEGKSRGRQSRKKISDPFWLGAHEVTQQQYAEVMGDNPSHFNDNGESSLQKPVERVTWLDAMAFCNLLSENERLPPYYEFDGKEVTRSEKGGYRMPTDLEWQFAAYTGDQSTMQGNEAFWSKVAWGKFNADGWTQPVGKLQPNSFGLYDMFGNVWEHLDRDGCFRGRNCGEAFEEFNDEMLFCNGIHFKNHDVGFRVARSIDLTKLEAQRSLPTFQGHRYKLVTTPATWHDAFEKCRQMGGYLCCIESEAEREFIKGLLEGKQSAWLGGSDEAVEGHWQWINGSEWKVQDWGTGWDGREPSNSYDAEHYLVMNGEGDFNDFMESKTLPYICEIVPGDDRSILWPPPGVLEAIQRFAEQRRGEPSVAFEDHSYRLLKHKMTWYQAKLACEHMGGYLCRIESPQEQSFVIRHVLESEYAWLGATDKKKEGTWTWTNGEVSEFSNWVGSEPSNSFGAEHVLCISPRSGDWNDFFGSARRAFICEWDETDPDKTLVFDYDWSPNSWEKKAHPEGSFPLGKSVDVLPTIDPYQHAIWGRWSRVNSGLKNDANNDKTAAFAPVVVRGSYEMEVEFTRSAGHDGIAIGLPVGHRSVHLHLGYASGMNLAGLGWVDGFQVDRSENKTRITDFQLKTAQRYVAHVAVRVQGSKANIRATLDGKPLIDWRCDLQSLEAWNNLPVPRAGMPNMMVAEGTSVVFHAMTIKRESGSILTLAETLAIDDRANGDAGKRPNYVPNDAMHWIGNWYWFSRYPAYWTEAQYTAEQMGGRLLVISSDAENEFVRSQSPAKELPIGGFRRDAFMDFINYRGEPLAYVRFTDSEPTNGGRDRCLRLLTERGLPEQGRWADGVHWDRRWFCVEWGPEQSLPAVAPQTLPNVRWKNGQPSDLIQFARLDDEDNAGRWTVDPNGRMYGESLVGAAHLHFPIALRGDYRLRATFSRNFETGALDFRLPVAGRNVRLILDGALGGGKIFSGLEYVAGQRAFDSENSTHSTKPFIEKGKRHTLEISVQARDEQASIVVTLDGQPVCKWTGPAAVLAAYNDRFGRYRDCLSIGTERCGVEFHELTLEMLSGEAKVIQIDKQRVIEAGSFARMEMDGLGDESLLLGRMPHRWQKEGVVCEIDGSGSIQFPRMPYSAYVLEMDLEIRNPHGRITVYSGEPGNGVEMSLGSMTSEDLRQDKIPCRLFRSQPFGVNWDGEQFFESNQRMKLMLVVADDRKRLFYNEKPVLGIDSAPADVCLKIAADDEADATIYGLRCRQLTPEDAKAAGFEFPLRQLKLDVERTKQRLNGQIARSWTNRPEQEQPFRVGTTGTPMQWLAPAEFTMGSTDAIHGEAKRPHQVRITRGYWMGVYEVSQAEWEMLEAENPSHITGSPYLPVNGTSWEDAMTFCRRLTEHEREAGRCPAGYEYRLPTEAEWEYACRAGDDELYPVPKDKVNCRANGGQSLVEVGATPPNAWGFYEMQGNVQEWCLDRWQGYPKDPKTVTVDRYSAGNPLVDWFVVRGNSFWLTGDENTAFTRTRRQNIAGGFRGFRIVLGPELDWGWR